MDSSDERRLFRALRRTYNQKDNTENSNLSSITTPTDRKSFRKHYHTSQDRIFTSWEKTIWKLKKTMDGRIMQCDYDQPNPKCRSGMVWLRRCCGQGAGRPVST